MEISSFLSIAIVGAILSFVVDFLKVKMRTTAVGSKALVALLSIVVAGGFWWLQSTPYIETVLTVLGMASTVYAFFLKK
tara:strand:- start:9782 stop:10018 length:237 start_codon:yes stop_codon:yes gene_type:complete